MEVNIYMLLEGLEDCSVPMDDENVVSTMKIKELTRMKTGNNTKKSRRGSRKRFITLALAAALMLSMGMVVYAVGEIYEYRKIKDDPALENMSDKGLDALERFTGGGYDFVLADDALYLDNEVGQSGVTSFYYTVEDYHGPLCVQYYDSGEIYALDARPLFPLDYEPYDFPFEYLDATYPDKEAYREKLIKAAPGIMDKLHEDGWVKHGSKDIYKADILPIHVFGESYGQIRVLTRDDNSYELWLEPESLAVEGFMYWNEKDTPIMRNGFFTALKEDRLEAWWDELMANSVG